MPNEKMERVDVPPDGNCFFHVLIHQIEVQNEDIRNNLLNRFNPPQLPTHQSLRQHIFDYIDSKKSEPEYTHYFDNDIEEMREVGKSIDSPVPYFAAEVLGVQIIIYRLTDSGSTEILQRIPESNLEGLCIFKILLNNAHYQSLEPIKKPEVKENYQHDTAPPNSKPTGNQETSKEIIPTIKEHFQGYDDQDIYVFEKDRSAISCDWNKENDSLKEFF